MTVKQMLWWLRARAPMVDWDVVDTGTHIVVSAPYGDGIRHCVRVTYEEARNLRP
jgi:hypothetical protein